MPLLGFFDSNGREIPPPGTAPVVSTSTSATSNPTAPYARLLEIGQELVRVVNRIECALSGTLSSDILASWRRDLVDRFVDSQGLPTSLLLRARGAHIDERKWTAMRAHLYEMLRLTRANLNQLLERSQGNAEPQVADAWTGSGFVQYVRSHAETLSHTTMPVQPQFVPNAIPDGPAEPSSDRRRGRSPPRVLSGDAYERARLAWQQGRGAER